MNQEILLMCEDEREEKEILRKILHNNFNERDYEEIEEKFKHKNGLEEDRSDKISNISFSHTENTANKYGKVQFVRESSASKEHHYRLSKRLNAINTHDLYLKPKPHKPALIGDEKSTANNNSVEEKAEAVEIKKLSAAEEFRKNIYDSIKQEIKESLRREYERKKQK
jgi:hypothetical protein